MNAIIEIGTNGEQPQTRAACLRWLMIFAIIALAGCGDSPEKARVKLAQLGKQYSAESFIRSASEGDVAAVKMFLDAGMGINTTLSANHITITALSSACAEGHEAVVKLLLERGADVNAVKDGSLTPLMFAAITGHVEIVKLLLQKNPALEDKTKDGSTALDCARIKNNEQVIKLLRDAGAVSFTDKVFNVYLVNARETALTAAFKVGQRFAKNGQVDDDGINTLRSQFDSHVIAGWKNSGISDAQTPAMLMEVYLGLVEGARMEFGSAVLTGHGKALQGALLQAASESWGAFEAQLRSVAVKYPQALNIRDAEGNTPLTHATQEGHLDFAKWIESQGGR